MKAGKLTSFGDADADDTYNNDNDTSGKMGKRRLRHNVSLEETEEGTASINGSSLLKIPQLVNRMSLPNFTKHSSIKEAKQRSRAG